MKCYDVDPDKLAQVFKNTTATYKYYWFLALLDSVRACKAHQPISFNEMVARMVSRAWPALTIQMLSFGKCDALLPRIEVLIHQSELKSNDIQERVYAYLHTHHEDPLVVELVKRMTKYVPYRFLYPWLGADMTNSATARASQNIEKYRCPYSIIKQSVIINPAWIEYLTDHMDILENFISYNLLLFLRKYNDKIILPDAEDVQATADGTSVNPFSQVYGSRVAESPAQDVYCLQRELNIKKRELNTLYKMFDTVKNTGNMNIYGNVNQAIGNVEEIKTK